MLMHLALLMEPRLQIGQPRRKNHTHQQLQMMDRRKMLRLHFLLDMRFGKMTVLQNSLLGSFELGLELHRPMLDRTIDYTLKQLRTLMKLMKLGKLTE